MTPLDLLQKLRSPANPRIVRRSIGRVLTPRLGSYYRFSSLFAHRLGLELGGPSHIFGRRGLFPIYPLAARVDNCNFHSQTVWEKRIADRSGFHYDPRRRPGRQFFAEATELSFANDDAYEFVLSSHMLEHSANPLKALYEWKRVLHIDGVLFLVVPHKEETFDHRRPVTSLEHLVEDYERDVDEHDLSHLPEILSLHDLALDPDAGSFEQFRLRSQRNFENRCLHHHVFDTQRIIDLVDLTGLKILSVERALPYHIAVLAQRVADETRIDNSFPRNRAALARLRRVKDSRPTDRPKH